MSVLSFPDGHGYPVFDPVSILILMDVCLKQRFPHRPDPAGKVSILILMDVCLKLIGKSYSLQMGSAGFNPYFNGCLS